MEGGKRTAADLSPLQRDSGKNRKITADMDAHRKIKDLEEKISEIARKDDVSNNDLCKMMLLTSEKDSLKNEYVIIPKIVTSLVEAYLTEAFAEGGQVRMAITAEIGAATEGLLTRVENAERKIGDLEGRLSEMRLPKKVERIVRNERARCIESSSHGLVMFGEAVREGETGSINDAVLKDLVREVVGEEEIESSNWRRMVGGTAALREWKGRNHPKISIRVKSREARERIVKRWGQNRRSGEGKQYDVKREIPELLLDEFQELQKEATEIRKQEKCQTYIGFAGHDIFLRRRKDATDKWKTIKRL